jgi:hypothetical protein
VLHEDREILDLVVSELEHQVVAPSIALASSI